LEPNFAGIVFGSSSVKKKILIITIVTDETLNGFDKQTKNMLLNGVIIEMLITLVTHNDTCILSVKHGQCKKKTTTKTKVRLEVLYLHSNSRFFLKL
jgi:hypothetical protein